MNKEIKISIEEILTESEIKDIAKEELRDALNQDAERVISNMAHNIAVYYIDSILTDEQKQLLKGKVTEKINEISLFHILRTEDYWNKTSSVGQKILEDAVRENKALFNKKVLEIVNNLSTYDIVNLIKGDLELRYKEPENI